MNVLKYSFVCFNAKIIIVFFKISLKVKVKVFFFCFACRVYLLEYSVIVFLKLDRDHLNRMIGLEIAQIWFKRLGLGLIY